MTEQPLIKIIDYKEGETYAMHLGVERQEELAIKIVVPICKLSEKQVEEVEAILGRQLIPNELTITWEQRFGIEYFGIIRRLEQCINLLDICSDWEVDTKELKHSRCIIQELLCKLEQLEGKYLKE